MTKVISHATVTSDNLTLTSLPVANEQYPVDTAGRMMTTDFIAIGKHLTATEALAQVKAKAELAELIYTIYVVDDAGRLEGVCSLRELMIAKADMLVADIMSHPAICVTTDTDQEHTARILAQHDFLAIPVVDHLFRLVGIVTVADAMDIIEDENTEDLFQAGRLSTSPKSETARSEKMIRGSLWTILRARLPFLLITLVAGMVAGRIVAGFEESLESIIAVAFFIPLVMDMGGNVGTQSSTVFARAVALGHIDVKKFARPFFKEVGIGVALGLISGVAGGLVAGIWQNDPNLGLAVGFALVSTVTLSALLGFLVPWALVRLGTDHAAGAAPIITSIKDITGLVIYFGFVMLFLGHLL